MSEISKTAQWIVWGGLGLLIAVIAAAYVRTELLRPPSPARGGAAGISGGSDSDELPVLSTVSDFRLTNQFGETITRADLAGEPWVADIIFTRCPSICPQMTFQMGRLQQALGSDNPTRLVSITTDPEFDTPNVLQAYGERFAAEKGRWHFLTGSPTNLGALIRNDLKLIAVEKPVAERTSVNDLYNHSILFAIVDARGRLRRVVHSTDTNINFIEEIVATVDRLRADD